MWDALSRRNQPATSSCTHINLDDSVKVPSAANIQNTVTSVSSLYPSTSNALEAIFAGANISSVLDCNFQTDQEGRHIIKKRRRRSHIFRPARYCRCLIANSSHRSTFSDAYFAIYPSFDMKRIAIKDVNSQFVPNDKALK